jgi:hypothetical protein
MLGNILHGYEDIYVSYELDFIDGIARGKRFSNQQWERLSRSPKADAWDLPWADLKAASFSCFSDCLRAIAHHYTAAPIFLFKNGKYRFYLKKLRREFPSSKIIFISRDPRSVYLSQSQSPSSITDQPMIVKDPVLFAKQYLLTERMGAAVDSAYLLRIRFEDLITSPEATVRQILSFLEVSDKQADKDYAAGISDNQKHLHSNVAKGMLGSRLYPWQETDRAEEVGVVEHLCKDYLLQNNYQLSDRGESSLGKYYRQYFMSTGVMKWLWYWTKAKFSLNKDHLRK